MTKRVYVPELGRSITTTSAILYFAKQNIKPIDIFRKLDGAASRDLIHSAMYQARRRGIAIPKWQAGRA